MIIVDNLCHNLFHLVICYCNLLTSPETFGPLLRVSDFKSMGRSFELQFWPLEKFVQFDKRKSHEVYSCLHEGHRIFQIQKSPTKESPNCRIYCNHFPDRIKTILVVNICSVSPFCLKCWKQSRGPNNLELHSGLSLRIAHLFSVCT